MITYSIYVVDDEETIRQAITTALGADYRVDSFSTAEAAIEAMKMALPDLVLLDIGLPGMSGIEALQNLRRQYPDVLIIMITAYEDVSTVVSAMKLGAYDYVVKPLHMDSLEVSIRNALDTITLRKEVQILQEKYLRENLPCFIGESNVIHDVMEFIGMVAKSPDTPTLIAGDTGTGKELLAGAIHYRSPNFKGPLITMNCAAIPKGLVESELFGYEKGAFSGANASGKKGLLEEAACGTLFLDEVGDLSQEAQAKLLRFLEDGEFYRVGGTKKLHIQTRVVSATNKDLESMLEQGTFRKDLFFRLGVIKVHVPSLNERREDIMPLVKHFLFEFNKKFDRKFSGVSPEAEEALTAYRWTGNVRELKNLIEKAVLIGSEPLLEMKDLGTEGPQKTTIKKKDENSFTPLTPEGIDLPSVQRSLEKFYFEEALKMAKGNESEAARLLNINHHTFRYRRKKLQVR